jgi:hypothetical protein
LLAEPNPVGGSISPGPNRFRLKRISEWLLRMGHIFSVVPRSMHPDFENGFASVQPAERLFAPEWKSSKGTKARETGPSGKFQPAGGEKLPQEAR